MSEDPRDGGAAPGWRPVVTETRTQRARRWERAMLAGASAAAIVREAARSAGVAERDALDDQALHRSDMWITPAGQ